MKDSIRVALAKAGFAPGREHPNRWTRRSNPHALVRLNEVLDTASVVVEIDNLPLILAALSTPSTTPNATVDALTWLVNLHHGVSKGGGAPSPSEWDEAYADAETALANRSLITPLALTDEERARLIGLLKQRDDAEWTLHRERAEELLIDLLCDNGILRRFLCQSESAPPDHPFTEVQLEKVREAVSTVLRKPSSSGYYEWAVTEHILTLLRGDAT